MTPPRGIACVVAVATVAVGLTACAGSAPRSPEPAMRLMHQNYARAGDLRAALIMGDLVLARDAARWIEENETAEPLPAGAVFHLTRLRSAARRVVAARDLEPGAAAAVDVAAACGACHADRAPGLGARFGAGAPPPTRDLATHMLRDSWAASRLWEGLVGPSDAAWDAGARVLAEEPLGTEDLGVAPPRQVEAEALAARAHRAAGRAVRATDVDERRALLVETLLACAGCHGLTGSP